MKTMSRPRTRRGDPEHAELLANADALLGLGCVRATDENRLAAIRSAPRDRGGEAAGVCEACLLAVEPTRLSDQGYRRYVRLVRYFLDVLPGLRNTRAAVERALAGE